MSEQEPDSQESRWTRWRRITVIGLALPLVAASLLIWSASGRESSLDKVPVAIVNNDTIITDPQPMAAGRSLTAALTHPDDPSKNLKWELSDEDDAKAGLKDGSFYAVLTIPSDFSQAVLSTGTDTPVQGELTLVSNAAASTTVPYLSEAIATAAAAALGNQITVAYLGKVYDGFNSLAQGNQQAASGAAQLADGTHQLSAGAGQLDRGADELSEGLDELASGSGDLADATGSLSSGATEVEDGLAELGRGLRRLDDGQARLASGARTVARDSTGLAAGAREVSRGARVVDVGTRVLAGGSRLHSARLNLLARQCSAAGGSASFCARLRSTADNSGRLATAADRLHGVAGRVAAGSLRLADGAVALARGNERLAGSAAALDAATGRLTSSTRTLQNGATSLARGAARVDRAAGRLAAGARSSASAGRSLAAGGSDLASSAGQVDDGAQQLSSSLAKAAAESPTYSKSEKETLSKVVAEPITLTSQVQHSRHGNGWLIALIVAAILWLAALVAAISLDISAIARTAMAPVASRVVAAAQTLPALGLGVLNALAVLLAVILFHPSTAAFVPLVLLVLLGSASFSMLALALRLRFGRVGVTAFVLLLILQLAASSNVVPIETAPGVLRALNGVLPLTVFVNGASQLVSGGEVASYLAVVAVLAGWALVAWFALVSGIKHRRMQDVEPPAVVVLGPARVSA